MTAIRTSGLPALDDTGKDALAGHHAVSHEGPDFAGRVALLTDLGHLEDDPAQLQAGAEGELVEDEAPGRDVLGEVAGCQAREPGPAARELCALTVAPRRSER